VKGRQHRAFPTQKCIWQRRGGVFDFSSMTTMPPPSVHKALELAAWSLSKNQYKHDDEDNDPNGNIHNILSFRMMVNPSPFTD
jgi:hypothetical protein